MDPTTDARSLVFDGKAGTGSAVIFKDYYRIPLDIGLRLDQQDAQRAVAQAKLDQQGKQLQEKQATAELSKFQEIDLTKAAAQDQARLTELWNTTVMKPTGALLAAGQNPMLARNGVAAAELRAKKQQVLQLATASQQRQAQVADNTKVILADSEGLYGDKTEYQQKLAAWNQLPIEQRAETDPPALEEFVNLDKVGANIISRLKLTERTDAERKGLQVTETTDAGITPENRSAAKRELLAMPGVQKKLQAEYEALPSNRRPASLDAFLDTRADKTIRDHEYTKHDEKVTFRQPTAASVSDRHWNVERNANLSQATALITKYNQLRSGSTEQFREPVVVSGKNYLKSDEFNNYTLGTFNGKPNQVRGLFRDERGGIYLATDESGGVPKPLTDAEAFNKFLLPAWTGGNQKGDPAILQEAARKFFVKGTNTLRTRALGNPSTRSQEQDARRVLARNDMAASAMNSFVVQAAAGLSAKSDPRQVASFNRTLERGDLAYGGQTLTNPRLEVAGTKEKPVLQLVHDVKKKGEMVPAAIPLKPGQLGELLKKGYQPRANFLEGPGAPDAASQSPGTTPTPAGLQAATVVKRGSSSSRSSGSTKGSSKQDRLGLGGTPSSTAKPTGKRNLLGL